MLPVLQKALVYPPHPGPVPKATWHSDFYHCRPVQVCIHGLKQYVCSWSGFFWSLCLQNSVMTLCGAAVLSQSLSLFCSLVVHSMNTLILKSILLLVGIWVSSFGYNEQSYYVYSCIFFEGSRPRRGVSRHSIKASLAWVDAAILFYEVVVQFYYVSGSTLESRVLHVLTISCCRWPSWWVCHGVLLVPPPSYPFICSNVFIHVLAIWIYSFVKLCPSFSFLKLGCLFLSNL